MQTKKELETWYQSNDPWGYETNPDDLRRKETILALLGDYERALDIGCGEGWLTKDLPAKEIHGIELSDLAASRFPQNVTRVKSPESLYDLVITTGTLYTQYDHESIANMIKSSATKHVLVAGIKDWLHPYSFGKIITQVEIPYREYTQQITLYEVTA